jgi:hypothetical protein
VSEQIANQNELQRIAANLHTAKLILEGDLLANLITHPIRSALLELKLFDLSNSLTHLHQACLAVEHNLFRNENKLAANHNALASDLAIGAASLLAGALQVMPVTAETGVWVKRIEAISQTFVSNRVVDYVTRLQMVTSGQHAKIRIDKSTTGSLRQFTVYIPGTQQWNPLASRNPLDVGSAIESAASGSTKSAAQKSVLAAMKQAGIGKNDLVILVGHSLGGIVAANIASQKQNFKVNGLITVGSPTTRVIFDPKIEVLNIGHSDDLVTKLDAAEFRGHMSNTNRFDWLSLTPKQPLEQPSLLPQHDLANYRNTAERIDLSENSQLKKIRDFFLSAGAGKISSQTFEIGRTPRESQ